MIIREMPFKEKILFWKQLDRGFCFKSNRMQVLSGLSTGWMGDDKYQS